MGKVIKTSLIFVLLVLSTFFIFTNRSTAIAPPQTLSITPSVVNELINPGSNAYGTVTATNYSSSVDSYKAYATPYSVVNENYDPSFLPIPSKTDVTSWFHITPNTGLLNPSQNTTIKYTITVPTDATPGGYYAAVFVQTRPLSASLSKNKQLNINERIGTIFYIEVTGPLNQQGKLTGWHTSFLQKPNITSDLTLNNTGDIYYVSTIHVTYSDILGNPKFSYTTQKVILQNTVRKIVVTWPDSPSFGLFKVKGTATAFGNIELNTEYVLVMSTTVRIVIIVVIVIIVILLTFLWLRIPYRPYSVRKR